MPQISNKYCGKCQEKVKEFFEETVLGIEVD